MAWGRLGSLAVRPSVHPSIPALAGGPFPHASNSGFGQRVTKSPERCCHSKRRVSGRDTFLELLF